MWIGTASPSTLPDPGLLCYRSSIMSRKYGIGYSYGNDHLVQVYRIESGRYGHLIYLILREDTGAITPPLHLSILILTPPSFSSLAHIREASRVEISIPDGYRYFASNILRQTRFGSEMLAMTFLPDGSNTLDDARRILVDVSDPYYPIIEPGVIS